MKKKGFTLVEIIVVVALIAFIGTVSFFGIRLVNKNIKENKLERIEDKILLAAEIYIETNKEVKNKVNDQGAIIPLNVLHNEGLINLDGIIDKNDDDYVVALLADPEAGEECESTYIEGSWKIGSKTLYICTKNDGSGESNIKIINPETMSNFNKAERKPFYFKGYEANNFVKLKGGNGTIYRIMSVDLDDTITLTHSSESFESVLINNSTSIEYWESSNNSFPIDKWIYSFWQSGDGIGVNFFVEAKCKSGNLYTVLSNNDVDYQIVPLADRSPNVATVPKGSSPVYCDYPITNTIILKSKSSGSARVTGLDYIKSIQSEIGQSSLYKNIASISAAGTDEDKFSIGALYKLHLNSSIKISSGTGSFSNPYVIEKS